MLKGLLKSQAAHRLGAAVLGAYLDFALRTTRFVVDGDENMAPFIAGGGVVAAFWHECLPLMPALWRRLRQANPARQGAVLISQHRDGQFIAAVIARLGVHIVHGSTNRAGPSPRDHGGAAALRALVRVLHAGQIVVLTPDGPRGPPRQAAGGMAQLAALAGVPVLPCAARLRHRILVPSWDHMIVPLPFGRGALVCLPALTVARDGLHAGTAAITAALTEAADRAEALCR